VWTGKVAAFSPDLELEHRELVLEPPLSTRASTGQLVDVPAEFQRVVLSESKITSLAVQYRLPRDG
jgi:hypothetical protein